MHPVDPTTNNLDWPPAGWLTKSDAAKRLGLSESRVAAMIGRGINTLETRSPISNQKVKLLHAGDIERTIFERDHPSEVPKLPARFKNPNAVDWAAITGRLEPLLMAPSAPVALKPWLMIHKAAEFSGLPASAIKALILSGQLPGIDCGPRPGGRWRVKRVDLEKLEGHR